MEPSPNTKDLICSCMFLQVRVARRSSAAVLSPHQLSSGSKGLGEEELENVSTAAVRRTTQASSECFCVH